MFIISKFTCENAEGKIVIDTLHPTFQYSVFSSQNGISIKSATLTVNGFKKEFSLLNEVIYEGEELKPFTVYEAKIEVINSLDEVATSSLTFETGFLSTKWKGNFISDKDYKFVEKKISPKPLTFKKDIKITKEIKSAKIYATAIGIYDLYIGNKKIGNQYFAPGFTSYKNHLQYQTYDVSEELKDSSTLFAIVAGGWAVGSFIFTRQNRITDKKQSLLLELHIVYTDGSEENIFTDETWDVSTNGNVLMADFYDGETYDANIDLSSIEYHKASLYKINVNPKIKAEYGAPTIRHEKFIPISIKTTSLGTKIYDFGQNFAGVVNLHILSAHKGQIITIKHAEVLKPDGELNTSFLRSAKATLIYVCKEDEQEFSPTLTYMGFRYISVEGIKEKDIEISAYALYSDIKEIGSFECSNEMINKLQSNIVWSAKSNFVDIPTDCPQRDERMGWTGDINVFSPTACFNFDMNRFLSKWLLDLKAEQLKSGGIPSTIPSHGYGFPTTMPVMAIDFWGDACIFVPYSLYKATGNKKYLSSMYHSMKKYVDACLFWSRLLSVGNKKYIWSTPSILHFGDWVAPDIDTMGEWQKRAKWTATASLRHTTKTLSEIAGLLSLPKDQLKYREISSKVAHSYVSELTDGNGKLLNEFQTAYVLPLYFKIFSNNDIPNAAKNLSLLVTKNDYCIGTGFPGTPYVLFALADNGYLDVAYKMLLNTKCPSWLYEVKSGATTVWERWDGLDENGECRIGEDGTSGMISFNHYASGAVGDFLYRRVAGIEVIEPGYAKFMVKPLLGGKLTYAKATTMCPFGKISSSWKIENGMFSIEIEVPIGATCHLFMPDGTNKILGNGKHVLSQSYKTKGE